MEWNEVYFPTLPVKQTAVILVGHGAEYDGFLELWQKMMESLTRAVQHRLGGLLRFLWIFSSRLFAYSCGNGE